MGESQRDHRHEEEDEGGGVSFLRFLAGWLFMPVD